MRTMSLVSTSSTNLGLGMFSRYSIEAYYQVIPLMNQDGSLLLPGETGWKNLAPMYDEVNKAVREVDQNTILFWEAATWSHWGFNSRFSPVNRMVVKFFK